MAEEQGVVSRDENENIRQIIDRAGSNTSLSSHNLNLVKCYSASRDTQVPSTIYDLAWRLIDLNKGNRELNCLLTHAGAGKLLSKAPPTVSADAYNLDYYDFEVFKAIFANQVRDGRYVPKAGDISEFFLGPEGKYPLYDLVFTHPHVADGYYDIDANDYYACLPPALYYVARASYFVKKGGWLIAIVSKKDERTLRSDRQLLNKCQGIVHYMTTLGPKSGEYFAVVFTKPYL